MSNLTPNRPNRGFHRVLEQDHPYIWVDSCIQAWPDGDYANAHKHGCTAYGVTAFHPQQNFEQSLEELMYWHLIARKYPNLLVATRVEHIRQAKAEGKSCFILFSQDGEFAWGKLHRLEAFYRLGMRVMIPAYNRNNLICGGVLDVGDVGLSRFGRLVVKEANRLGLLLDGTHISRRATLEIMELSEDPIIFSHCNPKALNDNPRNIDDEQIKMCAERGGVIGLVNWGPLCQKNGQEERPTVEDFIDHIDYVADLLGNTLHIGIGSDMSLGSYPDHTYDPWGHPDYPNVMARYNKVVGINFRSPLRFAENFDSFSDIPYVIERLEARGYKHEDIANILGENQLRLFERVWKPVTTAI
ncbi:dipeptidase [Meiothermus hypogaeus]|uniref:Membrane dipeptidase n=2 Tax=Meiothermus hypogaeus TaxID=884155 RepID=A0A511R4Z5_9DEIN|nr:membrane dipeptidase [Meiothermus hypogaeus]RIH75124.1 Membrane dipeptidase (Peptidase family M19) [Meiothermus hypogaeus]GEM84681.1 membrane dipeptidase [Meiothermus hypogaeus NBRC 106114]GIW36764.1 MAG: membrane dipeptidase [Meiothermus sp.]